MSPATRASTSRPSLGGLFDLQVNGFAGVDFQSDALTLAELRAAVRALRRHGMERILLTLITDDVDRMCRKLDVIEAHRREEPDLARTIVGYHLEGPYLLAESGFCGAHDPRWMHPPRMAEWKRLWAASGENVRLVTLAPELRGSPEFIRELVRHGVRVAVGHSNVGDAALDDAIAAGLSVCTHLGNGVPQLLHRHDNVMQRLLARDELYATFIPDGIHLPWNVLRNFVRAKPKAKVLFTTDCMSAAGAPPGRYRLAGMELEVGKDRVVRQPGQTRSFAGSALTLDEAVTNLETHLGWTHEAATAACGARVARFLGFKA
jgi:N-acetylglucosamine-6-phosphate deacetylase